MECGTKLSKFDEGVDVDPTYYGSLIGSLRYLTCTRPDIMYSVGIVSRYMEKPKSTHLKAAKRILCYIKITIDHDLHYTQSKSFQLRAYSDSDYVGDIDDRKSTTDFVFFLCDTAFTWSSKKQPSVTLSTCEAEYVAASSFFYERSKHIDVRYHFIREQVKEKEIEISHVKSEDQVADIFTKPLKVDAFWKLKSLLGMIDGREFGLRGSVRNQTKFMNVETIDKLSSQG
ncbi:secreted RxLR effector protein 161-like [Syzygium oleosum]|uniref:secreted RxLR effector protein 161-like n=1 Tax=Syzygium oleosum TaxID=219896 RepID=UPI0024B973CE|nr:secreted RxLR effector protein 161-like [Syzygium oleosum]